MEKIFVFGHKNPDTDTITSSLVMEDLEKKMGNSEAKAYRLGNINKETEYALNYFKVKELELLEEIPEKANVILVDHNSFIQSVNGIEKANITKVVDHHCISNFETDTPLYYIAEPVGCTATILYELYKINDVKIEEKIAGLMLSAIISDTLLFKSPTCTEKDKKVADELAKITNVDIQKYGMDMLKAGTDLSDFSAEELINLDSKSFETRGLKFQIAQVNTASIEEVLRGKEDIENAINDFIKKNGTNLFLFAITDIINSNSQAIVLGDKAGIAEKAFKVELKDNMMFLPGVVSRKKQIIPVIQENA